MVEWLEMLSYGADDCGFKSGLTGKLSLSTQL